MKIPKAVKKYQCVGCIGDDDCFKKCENSLGCTNHNPGTVISAAGYFERRRI